MSAQSVADSTTLGAMSTYFGGISTRFGPKRANAYWSWGRIRQRTCPQTCTVLRRHSCLSTAGACEGLPIHVSGFGRGVSGVGVAVRLCLPCSPGRLGRCRLLDGPRVASRCGVFAYAGGVAVAVAYFWGWIRRAGVILGASFTTPALRVRPAKTALGLAPGRGSRVLGGWTSLCWLFNTVVASVVRWASGEATRVGADDRARFAYAEHSSLGVCAVARDV